MIAARHCSARLLLALSLGTLLGCGEQTDETTAADPPALPSASESGDGLRAARGSTGSAQCDGASDDPDAIEILMLEAAEGSLPDVIEALEALAGRHPGSATARVRLGELLLRTHPPAPDRAQTWFARALELDTDGCTLGYRDRWGALEGSAISRFMQGDYAGAIPFLERSLAAWPTTRGTRYNLACALCQTGEVDACERELTRLMNSTAAPPEFLPAQQGSIAHYRGLAQRDSDLEPLRTAGRLEAILAE